MIIDILIVIFLISALYRGTEIGFVRQFGSTAGFFIGLFVGAWLQKYTVSYAGTPPSRAIITIFTTMGCAFLFLSIGEYLGATLKKKVITSKLNNPDNLFGSLLSAGSLLLSVWLIAAIFATVPFDGIRSTLRDSRIVRALNQQLPAAPEVISSLSRLIDPNGFPNVFIGIEPNPSPQVPTPSLGELQSAVSATKASVVKIEGIGCGGIVDGSGFVIGKNLIATNAHVVAGIKRPEIMDANGRHASLAIWFDPKLDLAILRTSDLAGSPLTVSKQIVNNSTTGAVLGYPGGGPFSAGPAVILSSFVATGRDIYGRGATNRSIYEMQATVIPGNSGGPVVDKNGTVIGVVFAESTSYDRIGYALTTDQVATAYNKAVARNATVSTGSCAE